MTPFKRLFRTAAALGLAIVLSGCIIVPARGPYYHPYYHGY